MVCSGHGLYYKQFPKDGRPNHPETFLRQIRDYEENFSEEIHSFTPESSGEIFFSDSGTREERRERGGAGDSDRTIDGQLTSG
jgi:hypothetical protein